ncbi:MAG: diguanylate cyclase [Woeseiaceae bacterium]|nr:diguanylate cyclase [Woeseiaceae bacterium]
MVEDELSTLAQVTIDRVTGLSNRSGFLEIAGHLLPLCQRKGQPAALWMFQIQNLLDIESRVSKEEADATATEFADILRNGFRESDVVARLSFDVFAVLLAGSSLNDTQQARKLLDEVLGERNAQQPTERFLELASFAAAYEPSRHDNASDLLRDAETGLIEVSTTQVA